MTTDLNETDFIMTNLECYLNHKGLEGKGEPEATKNMFLKQRKCIKPISLFLLKKCCCKHMIGSKFILCDLSYWLFICLYTAFNVNACC